MIIHEFIFIIIHPLYDSLLRILAWLSGLGGTTNLYLFEIFCNQTCDIALILSPWNEYFHLRSLEVEEVEEKVEVEVEVVVVVVHFWWWALYGI